MTRSKTRDEAVSRMKRALNGTVVEGVKTTLPFHCVALEDDKFDAGRHTTDFVDSQDIIREVRTLAKR